MDYSFRASRRFRFALCYNGLILLLVLLFISKTVVRVQGSGSDLQDRWSLPEDGPTSFDYDEDETDEGAIFFFEFPISKDVATDDNVDVSFYDQGCRYNDGDPKVEIFKGISENVSFRGTENTIFADLNMRLGTSETNLPSLLQEYPTLWDEEKSQISFCVRFSLVTDGIEVNFLETVVILKVNLVAGFQIIDVSVAPKEKIESFAGVSYDVTAYLCGGNYKPLEEETTGLVEMLYEVCDADNQIQTISEVTEITNTAQVGQEYQQELSESQKVEKEPIIYPQGSVVRVCIRPDDTVYGEVSMRTIEALVFEGTYTAAIDYQIVAAPPLTTKSNGVFTQYAVKDGSTDVSFDLSYMSCESNRLEGHDDVVVCAVDTVLVAAFFWRTPGVTATVTAYGVATLQFGTPASDERNLERTVTSELHLQSGEDRPSQRQAEVDLEKIWSMDRPIVDFSTMREEGGFDFDMEYTFSDAISNEMILVEAYNKECEQPGEEPIATYPFLNNSQASSDLLEVSFTKAYKTGTGQGTQKVKVTAQWKRQEKGFMRSLQDSELYSENSDGSFVQISVCIRCQLHTSRSDGGIEVNFLETPVILNIDLKAGVDFGINFGLVPDDDKCLAELQRMSGGGFDSLYENALYWKPGSSSVDPSMPMGPSVFGSYSSRYGTSSYGGSGSGYRSSHTRAQPGNKFFGSRPSSATSTASLYIGARTTAIGFAVSLLVVLSPM